MKWWEKALVWILKAALSAAAKEAAGRIAKEQDHGAIAKAPERPV